MKKLYRIYVSCLTLMLMLTALTVPALAVDDMWTVANTVIVDVYSKIAGLSTVLAGLMSAVAVVGLAQTHLDCLGNHQRHWRVHRLCCSLV